MNVIDTKVKSMILPFVQNLEAFTEDQLNTFYHQYFVNFRDMQDDRKQIAIEFLKNYKSYIQYMIDNFDKETTMVVN